MYKRQGYLQTDVLLGNHKTKSAVLFRLLTQTKKATNKSIVSVTNIQKEKVEKDDRE